MRGGAPVEPDDWGERNSTGFSVIFPQAHRLRNHTLGSKCSGAASGLQLVTVMRTRMSFTSALAYSTKTSK